MENKKPFISVIMPVYNAENYLRDSIESVLNQTFQDIELILVNDCSSDNSANICLEFEKRDCRVRFISLEKNVGAGKARNIGITKANGHYLTFVDSDDILPNDIYENAVEKSNSGRIDLVVWGLTEIYFDKKGQKISEKTIVSKEGIYTEDRNFALKILELEKRTLLGYQWNKLYKRELIKKYNILSEAVVLYEDFFFTMQFCNYSSSVSVLERSGYEYCKRFNGNVTSKTVPEYFSLSRRRVKEMLRFCSREGIEKEASDILAYIYLRYILSGIMRMYENGKKVRRKEKTSFIERLNHDEVFLRTVVAGNVKNHFLCFFKNTIIHRRYELCFFIGKAIFCIRYVSNDLFEKIKIKQRES